MTDSLTNNAKFVQAIKDVENNYALAKRSGEIKPTGVSGEIVWFPGKSPEGGLPTLAWGHKLTPTEWEKKMIYGKSFAHGMTDAEVHEVLLKDLTIAEARSAKDWNIYQGDKAKMPWDSLKEAYRAVLVNLAFNAGLVKEGKWVWNNVAKGIIAGDDNLVVSSMVTSYKKPDGTRVRLTTRAKRIAEAMGLPTTSLAKVE
jgi:hypothetical protein